MDYVLLSNKGEMLKPLKETLNDCNKEAFKPIIKGKEDTILSYIQNLPGNFIVIVFSEITSEQFFFAIVFTTA